MDALTQFLGSEILWVGQRLTPTAGQVLAELCRKAKASDPAAGIKVKLEFLGSHGPRQASRRAVDDAVALLLQVGLIARERRRPRGARLKEEVAVTHLNPAFIEIALAWHRRRAALRAAGKRGHLAYPLPAEIELPMTFIPGPPRPRDLRMAITPKKDAPSGNPMPMRVASVPARKYCALQYANFAETGIHTPLAAGLDARDLGGQGVHSSAVSAARERRSPPLPPATAGWGGWCPVHRETSSRGHEIPADRLFHGRPPVERVPGNESIRNSDARTVLQFDSPGHLDHETERRQSRPPDPIGDDSVFERWPLFRRRITHWKVFQECRVDRSIQRPLTYELGRFFQNGVRPRK
ncbi:hypothetical protein PMI12_02376 [Variovorax sp. CF313]|nr:hypothetical protein PMI12_02376 [Variovorax sp. CF313]